MSTNSTSPAASDLSKKWWLWPFVPFIFLAGLFGIVAFFLLVVICWPYIWLKSWRERAIISRNLIAEQRSISWTDAFTAMRETERKLVLELGPKGPGSMWLVDVPADSTDDLLACPTYADWEADPRSVWENCVKIDESAPQLVTYLQHAKRIEDHPNNLSELDSRAKTSIRILTVFNAASPSAFLHRSIRSNNNA